MMCVAYQGVYGAYSYIAAKECYPDARYMPCSTFADVFAAVQNGKADVGVIPVENSHAGRVADVHFLLSQTKLHICREYFLRIEHQLIGLKGAKLENIKEVHSHPQALMQCSSFLQEHELVSNVESDTAISCQKIKDLSDLSHAAIASKIAAEDNDLQILASNVENVGNNTTRFLVMTKQEYKPQDDGGNFLVSLMFKTKNQHASLYNALGAFAQNKINMAKIESYMPEGHFVPAQFYIEIETHVERDSCKKALCQLKEDSKDVSILGVYKAHPYRKL